jgi:hypothetical protein
MRLLAWPSPLIMLCRPGHCCQGPTWSLHLRGAGQDHEEHRKKNISADCTARDPSHCLICPPRRTVPRAPCQDKLSSPCPRSPHCHISGQPLARRVTPGTGFCDGTDESNPKTFLALIGGRVMRAIMILGLLIVATIGCGRGGPVAPPVVPPVPAGSGWELPSSQFPDLSAPGLGPTGLTPSLPEAPVAPPVLAPPAPMPLAPAPVPLGL